MNRLLLFCFLSLIVVFTSLSLAFAVTNHLWVAAILFGLCTVWGFAIWRKWHIRKTLSLYLIILSISIATMMGGPRWLVLTSSLATLTTWNLSAFYKILTKNKNILAENELIRTHLLRLSSVVFLGIVLPIIAFAMTFELKFWQVFILGLVLLLGLSQVFSQLKRSSTCSGGILKKFLEILSVGARRIYARIKLGSSKSGGIIN